MAGPWGFILNGRVWETVLVDPAGRYVPSMVWLDLSQFTPQPDIGWTAVETNGAWSFTPPPAIAPTLAQQAAAALDVGCQIVSAGTPALDGTYACNLIAQQRLTSIQTRINAGLGLPLGSATIDWLDTGGTAHAFTAAQFTTLAAAIGDYAYELELLTLGQNTALPSQPKNIA